jgi:cytochrome P450
LTAPTLDPLEEIMSLPPGSRLPALAQTLWYVARPNQFLETNARRHGDTFTIRTVGFGVEVCVSRPEAIKEIFTGDPEIFRAGEANTVLRPIVGSSSVLLLDSAAHMRQRRLMLPAFHGERMSAYTKIMVEETERAVARWPFGEAIALRSVFQRVTLAIILRAVFGADDADEQKALAEALREMLDFGATPLGALPTLIPALRQDLGRYSPWGAVLRRRDKADALIYALIARRRASGCDGRTDVLSMMMSAKDEHGQPMTDSELRDELITLLIAGHETTATTLCWLFEELLPRGDVMAEVDHELRAVTGGEPLGAADVPKLKVLESVIKEAMRLHPVVPVVARRLKAPARIAGYDLPAGITVVPAIHLTHRLPDIYPDPLRFKFDRFIDKKVDPYAWLPFGGGVRRCLGMAFALQELKVVLGTVFASRHLRLASPKRVRTVLRGITHAPSGATSVVAEPRSVPAALRGPRTGGPFGMSDPPAAGSSERAAKGERRAVEHVELPKVGAEGASVLRRVASDDRVDHAGSVLAAKIQAKPAPARQEPEAEAERSVSV